MHLCLKPNRLFSLFKIFVLQRPDIKRVMQKRLVEYDWLWKVLVYGSYLDFNFLKSLKEEYPSIREKIEQDNLLYGQGIHAHEGKIDSSHLVGKKLLEHKYKRLSCSIFSLILGYSSFKLFKKLKSK